jgi:hypothetical protein
MLITVKTHDDAGKPIEVEASVFPRTVLREDNPEVKPSAVLISIRDAGEVLVDHLSLPREFENRLKAEAIAEARRQVQAKNQAASGGIAA